jgi:rhamnosyltransferase
VKSRVGVIFITHNARRHLPHCLGPVMAARLADRVLVVNSSSTDGTVEAATEMGAEVLVIPRKEFNHGATRELARKRVGTEVVVMMTPDAYPTSPDFLRTLIRPIQDGQAAAAYARQIPHDGADFLERFPREFNYPAKSQIRGLEDLKQFGSYLFFCSNSCAAWSNDALDSIGGFPTVLTNEDTFAAARLLSKGHRVAYVAESVVRHSHRYSLLQEFQRYVDTGYARELFGAKEMLDQRDEGHGKKFAGALLARLRRERPTLLPYAMAQLLLKYIGYRLGRVAVHLPVDFMRRLSTQDYYWNSIHLPRK